MEAAEWWTIRKEEKVRKKTDRKAKNLDFKQTSSPERFGETGRNERKNLFSLYKYNKNDKK